MHCAYQVHRSLHGVKMYRHLLMMCKLCLYRLHTWHTHLLHIMISTPDISTYTVHPKHTSTHTHRPTYPMQSVYPCMPQSLLSSEHKALSLFFLCFFLPPSQPPSLPSLSLFIMWQAVQLRREQASTSSNCTVCF